MSYQIRFKKIGNVKKFSIFKKKDPNSISLKKDYSFSEACEVYQTYVSTVEEDFDFEINLFNNIDSYSFDLRSKGSIGLDTLIIDDINTSLKDCDREEELILQDLQRQLLEIIDHSVVKSEIDEGFEQGSIYDEPFEEDYDTDYEYDSSEDDNFVDEYDNYLSRNDFDDSEIQDSQENDEPLVHKSDESALQFEDYISLDDEVIEKGRALLCSYQVRFQDVDEYLRQKFSFSDFDENLVKEKWAYLKSIVDPLKFEKIVSQVESDIDESTSHLTDQLERKYIECNMTETGIETVVQNQIEKFKEKLNQEIQVKIAREIDRAMQENDETMAAFKEQQSEALNAFIQKQKEELELFTSRQKGQLNERVSEIEKNGEISYEQKIASEMKRIEEAHIKNARSILMATKKKGALRFNQSLNDIQMKAKNSEQEYIHQLKEEVEKQTPLIQKKLDQLFEKQMIQQKLQIQDKEIELKEKELAIQEGSERNANETIKLLVENKEKEIQRLKEEYEKEKAKEVEFRLQLFDKQINYMDRINQSVLNRSAIDDTNVNAIKEEKKSSSDIDTKDSKAINNQLNPFAKDSKKSNWKSTLFVCGAFLLGIIAASVPISLQGKNVETTVAQLEKKVSAQELGNSEKLVVLQNELEREKEEKKKLNDQVQQLKQENSYDALIQKSSYIEAGRRYPEKIVEIENLLFEQEKLPELKAFNELMPSEFGTLDVAILEKNYVRVTEIYTVLLNKDISPKRKQGVALAYSQLGYYDMASWILR